MVHVVKFADREHARREELAVRDEGDSVNRLRGERRREPIHGFAPSPKIVRLTWGRALGAAAHSPLKGMRVREGERRKIGHDAQRLAAGAGGGELALCAA